MENASYCTFMAPRKYHQTNSPIGRDPHDLGRLILLLHCSASTMNLTKFQIAGKKKFSPECDIKSRNSAQSSSRGATAEDPEGPGTVMIQSETSAVNCPRFPWSTGKYKYPRMTSFFRCPSNGAMLQRNKFPHISYTGECLQPTFLRSKASRKGAKLSDLFVLFENALSSAWNLIAELPSNLFRRETMFRWKCGGKTATPFWKNLPNRPRTHRK